MQNYNQQYGGYPQGNQAAPMYCANCGAVMPQGSVYCPYCGHANVTANTAPNMPPMGEMVSKADYLKKYSMNQLIHILGLY